MVRGPRPVSGSGMVWGLEVVAYSEVALGAQKELGLVERAEAAQGLGLIVEPGVEWGPAASGPVGRESVATEDWGHTYRLG